MTIKVESGQSGWGNYVLYGTREVPRDTEKVQLIDGDIALGDKLCESNNYKESYYRIVLGFEGKPSDEVMLSAYEDFKKEFFVGFKPDEYHTDAVIHKDTEHYHIHIRVPKQNLLTDTHLQLYMDKFDRPRKELIQDHISLKYGFNIARETNQKVFKKDNKNIEIINKQREAHNQKPYDFSNKKGQAEAEKELNSYLSDLIKAEVIKKREDLTAILKELGLKIEKENGLDIKKDFCYTTVSNETGKLRIKGEIHNDRFYNNNQNDRSSQIDNDRRIEPSRGSIQERAKQVQRELRKANEKRFNKVTELFKSSRARAEAEHSKTFEAGKLQSLDTRKSVKSITRYNRNDISKTNTNTRTNEAGKIHREQKLGRNRWEKVAEIPTPRVALRQSSKSLLLQNKLKENYNEINANNAIKRARSSRENNHRTISEISRTNQRQYKTTENARNQRTKIHARIEELGSKVRGAIRELSEQIKQQYNEVVNMLKAKPPREAPTVGGSDSSLSKTEKLEIHRQKVKEADKIKEAEQTQIKQEATTHKRSRSRGFSR